MNTNAEFLSDIGEPFASGLLELSDNGSLPEIYCRAYRRYYETCPIVYKAGSPLFPSGLTTGIYTDTKTGCEVYVIPSYATQIDIKWDKLREKSPRASEIMTQFTKSYSYAGE